MGSVHVTIARPKLGPAHLLILRRRRQGDVRRMHSVSGLFRQNSYTHLIVYLLLIVLKGSRLNCHMVSSSAKMFSLLAQG